MTIKKDIINIKNKIQYDKLGCWIWLGHINNKNCCKMRSTTKSLTVNRILYSEYNILTSSDILIKTCKNIYCVNPEHHYKITRKEASIKKEIPLKERLLSSILIDKDTKCWNWQNSKDRNGYGLISYRSKDYYAHRLSFELFKNKLKKPIVLHSCDNPSCINPEHLSEGTQLDNIKDAINKNRMYFQKIKTL